MDAIEVGAKVCSVPALVDVRANLSYGNVLVISINETPRSVQYLRQFLFESLCLFHRSKNGGEGEMVCIEIHSTGSNSHSTATLVSGGPRPARYVTGQDSQFDLTMPEVADSAVSR